MGVSLLRSSIALLNNIFLISGEVVSYGVVKLVLGIDGCKDDSVILCFFIKCFRYFMS